MKRRLSEVKVGAEFASVDLGDKRRDARVKVVVEHIARRPAASFPTQMGSEAKLEAFYRLVGNSRVDHQAVMDPHRELTAARAAEHGDVVIVHDTSAMEFAHADPEDVGFLATGRPGFLGHFSLVVTADGERRPLGVAAFEALFRAQRSGRGSRKRHVSGAETASWEDREFLRWGRGFESAETLLKACASRIHVADREADSFALFEQLLASSTRFIIRTRHDRSAQDFDAEEGDWSKLKSIAASAESRFQREVPLSPRRGSTAPRQARSHRQRKMRVATLGFSAVRMKLRRPRNVANAAAHLSLNIVRVCEVDAPAGEQPIEWLLVTTEAVRTKKDIERIVDLYRTRWVIEEFFKALKTGCAYEKRELESRHALLNALALLTPVACHLLWLRSVAQHASHRPATHVISARQLSVLRALQPGRVPDGATARDVLLAIAELGGHVSNNGEPGWLTIWRGFEALLQAERGWMLARSQ